MRQLQVHLIRNEIIQRHNFGAVFTDVCPYTQSFSSSCLVLYYLDLAVSPSMAGDASNNVLNCLYYFYQLCPSNQIKASTRHLLVGMPTHRPITDFNHGRRRVHRKLFSASGLSFNLIYRRESMQMDRLATTSVPIELNKC